MPSVDCVSLSCRLLSAYICTYIHVVNINILNMVYKKNTCIVPRLLPMLNSGEEPVRAPSLQPFCLLYVIKTGDGRN